MLKFGIFFLYLFEPIKEINPMNISNSSAKLRKIIDKAIEDHKISKAEYDMIIHEATQDGHLDAIERALLAELQDMIESKVVRMIP